MAEETSTTTKKKNWFSRHKILTIVLVLILLGIISSAGGHKKAVTTANIASSSSSDLQVKPANNGSGTSSLPKLNQAARDGKFEFTVKSIDCSKTTVGTNQYLTKTAQGKYCLLDVSVKNIGNEAQSLFSANQKLLNASGQVFSADDQATMYDSPDTSSTWYSQINPGNTVEGSIAFDLPTNQIPVQAVLHDSAGSGGVKVSLQ